MIICNPKITPKNKHIQSLLASSKIRLLSLSKNNPIKTQSKELIIETSTATLQGFFTQNKTKKDLYILLHGWEGSANSTYIQLLANTLFEKKQASIFRLNFRDHGDTHHLNKALFHSCRLEEVVDTIKQVIERQQHQNVYFVGFSLGGNFALRVTAKLNTKNLYIKKTFAISPPLSPKNSMLAIERAPIYSQYFMKKWKKSLAKKRKLFPKLFDGYQYQQIKSLDKLTEVLIIKHSDYNTTDEYYKGYQITQEVIANIKTPCHVITAWDDPVIPFDDFLSIDKKQNISLVTTKNGGHCGFINSWKLNSWIEQYIIENS